METCHYCMCLLRAMAGAEHVGPASWIVALPFKVVGEFGMLAFGRPGLASLAFQNGGEGTCRSYGLGR